MKKRILSVLLTLVMLIGLVSVMSVSASAAGEHTHCVCGEAHASVGDHTAEQSVEWTAWDGTSNISYTDNVAYVYLSDDVELTATLTVANGKTLYLCLNGYSITPADSFTNGRAIEVDSGATFVLTDCGDGSISGFTTSNHGNGTGVYNKGTFTMYAGAISYNTSDGHGGGVYNSGTFTMYDGTISNNELTAGQAYGRGAGVYQKSGAFTMYGGTITENEAVSSGGGVYYSGGTFTMYGGTIGENWANSGGGVYGNYFAMHGGSVINNTATAEGGGIHNYNGTLELSGNVTITGNKVNDEQSDIFIGYTVITIKEDFAPTSAIGVRKDDVIGTIVRAADGETLDIENYKQYFVGEEGIPVYAEGNALELGYTVIEEPDDTNNHTVKTNSDANASYQWVKYGLIAYSVVYESSYGPMSLRSVTPMPGMEDALGIKAAEVDACGYWDYNTWVYYANYDAENKYWIASNNVLSYEDPRDCSHEFDASYFIIVPAKNGTLSVTLIDPLDDGEELVLYIMEGEGYSWPFEEVTPNADGSYSLTAGFGYRLLIKDSDDTNNGTYEDGFNDAFPKLTATFTAMGASELLDGQNEATLDITGLGGGAYLCKTTWDIYDTPEDPEDDYYCVSAPVARYDVIFDYGTLGSETKTVWSGETVTPPAPVFGGKVLVGWYADSSFTTEFNFSDAINTNKTIYAKFTAAVAKIEKTGTNGLVDTYTITYTNGTTTTFTVTNGEKGDEGDQGIQGIQGEKGADGHTPVITIQDGYWYIDGVNTNQAAQGVKGDTGNGISDISKTGTSGLVDTYTITYTNGTTTTFTVTNGEKGDEGDQGIQGIQGEKGADGHTPIITIQNGYWYIDGINTNQAAQGVKGDKGDKGDTGATGATGAQGPQGEKGDKGDTGAAGADGTDGADGVGIAKIEKTSSDGNVDTYTITLTNGTTYTFTVTNGTNGTDGKDGKDGVDGKDGTDGEDGPTPYIGENGNWWIGDTDTGVKAAGNDGKDGAIIVATAVGGTALISNIALIAWTLIKKKRLF